MTPKNSTSDRINVCHPAPFDKRKYIGDIGRILVRDYGKKKYYKPKQVKEAHKKSEWRNGDDFSCWAMSMFTSHGDFDRHHEAIGEVCNYTEMKSTMLEGISTSDTLSISSISAPDLDASWLDIGNLFDGIFEGIGEFFCAIAEGVDL
jgi:hypothetical protein